jgi:hypothetical protein
VFQNFGSNYPVECPGRKRKSECITSYRHARAAGLANAIVGITKAGNYRRGFLGLALVSIERNHPRPEAHRFKCVPSTASPEVKKAFAGANGKFVVPDGQHAAPAARREWLSMVHR